MKVGSGLNDGLRCRVQGLRFMDWDSGFEGSWVGFRVSGVRFMVQDSGFEGLWSRVYGLEFRV